MHDNQVELLDYMPPQEHNFVPGICRRNNMVQRKDTHLLMG